MCNVGVKDGIAMWLIQTQFKHMRVKLRLALPHTITWLL